MTQQRNVLLIQTDAQHHAWLGFRGTPGLRTPNLDALVANGAAVFNNAYSCSGVCVPSRVSLMTGRYPIGHGVTCNNIARRPEGEPWLGRQLRDAGYATGYFGKTHFAGNDHNMAEEGWSTSFIKYEYADYLKQHGLDIKYPEGLEIDRRPVRYWAMGPSRIPKEHYFENVIADRAVQFIEEHKNENFACYVSNVAPHGPFTPPEPYASMYDPKDMVLPPREAGECDGKARQTRRWIEQNGKYFNDDELKEWLAIEYGLITMVDDNVGKLIDALKRNNLYDDTLIVFLSDHGDFAARYGIIGKSWTMTDDLIRIPLIIRHPEAALSQGDDKQLPVQVDSVVQSIDVTATIHEWVGMEPVKHTSGRTLGPLLRGEASSVRDTAFACDHAEYTGDHLYLSMARTDRWKLVMTGDDQFELYDMQNDPMERVNLANKPEQAAIRAELQHRLLLWHIEHCGLYYNPDRAGYWEDETLFYDETKFCGERISKVAGGTPTS